MAKERVFLRGMQSGTYSLTAHRQAVLDAPRVRRGRLPEEPGAEVRMENAAGGGEHWILAPGDDPFLTQALQVHYMVLPPGGSNGGHGHQNEAAFYFLEGRGYDIHDGERYEWEAGDLLVVHADSVHRHFNADADRRAVAVVFKAKALWMYLGLVQQGKPGEATSGTELGPPRDWSAFWTSGTTKKRKLVHPADVPWEQVAGGRARVLASGEVDDVRLSSVDLAEVEIDPGGSTRTVARMADEAVYVLSGSCASEQWEVRAEIGERFMARVALEPQRWEASAGDVVYVPPCSAHRLVNTSSEEPLRVLVGRNRLFAALGYGGEWSLEDG